MDRETSTNSSDKRLDRPPGEGDWRRKPRGPCWPARLYLPLAFCRKNLHFACLQQSGQYFGPKTDAFHAWAVRPGDVAAVPEPGAAALFCAGLAGLALARRRNRSNAS
ncbi:PEP-CTERM sorting domain-containing protein [Methyloversatilis sp.]|uniref:PEP-CTERM sorting domain-containing protein n=1 Tax=Methyloversatilis sp. TaxID=2569862 RepID=UPI00352490DC